jgi:hypothetical protein
MRKSLRWISRAVALVALVLSCGVAGVVLPAGASAAEPPCPNEQFRGESLENSATKAPYSMQLPDCRAYELVSAPNTLGQPAITLKPTYAYTTGEKSSGPLAMVTPGGAILYMSEAVPPETGAVPNGREGGVFVSDRGPAGWGTTDLTPFEKPGAGAVVELFAASADGSKALISTTAPLVPEDQDTYGVQTCESSDFYVVSKTHGAVLVSRGSLKRSFPPYDNGGCVCGPPINGECVPGRGISFNEDLTAVGFGSQAPLDPGVNPPHHGHSGPFECYTWSDGGAQIAMLTDLRSAGPEGEDECEQVGMMPDGHPIFLDTNSDPYYGPNRDPYQGRLFIGGSGSEFPEGVTQISGDTPGAASFDGVSPDGGTVYITTTDHLVASNTDTGADIYAVGVPAVPSGATPPSDVVCVSCGAGGEASFVAQSADGSHLVFKTPGGLWSWDAQSGLATKLTGATSYSEISLSQGGQFVVIVTSEALVAQDLNGTPDIYELTGGVMPVLVTSGASTDTDAYSAPAVSSDGRRVVYDDIPSSGAPEVVDEWVNGETSQVSPVGAQHSSVLLGAAGEGLQDIFFVANDPLVTQDLNAGEPDIYDARVGGGSPASPPAVNDNRTANPTDLLSSPYPANLTPPSVQPPLLAADSSAGVSKAKALTDVQKLANALKACKKRPRRQQAACVRQARKQYGKTTKKKIKSAQKGKSVQRGKR